VYDLQGRPREIRLPKTWQRTHHVSRLKPAGDPKHPPTCFADQETTKPGFRKSGVSFLSRPVPILSESHMPTGFSKPTLAKHRLLYTIDYAVEKPTGRPRIRCADTSFSALSSYASLQLPNGEELALCRPTAEGSLHAHELKRVHCFGWPVTDM
jgi:hypothetical protein